ncbi:hypothetical protein [Thermanaeromonas sp. C210]|uniref:hypothetical protein n=1 Tax=Thermanaeromonas sp. C210 TaxID=2731925 RepID=UPI001C25DC37|nr:hypothetical protein [Thermanaeromonas sp. C210]
MQKQSGTYQGIAWTAEVHHLRDRWTGQSWVAIYGNDAKEKKWYSGEMRPIPSQGEIAQRKEQVLERLGQREYRDTLNAQLAECYRIKELNEGARNKYNQALLSKTVASLPREVIDGFKAWEEANNKGALLAKELADVERQAEETAVSELARLAWEKRKLATAVWGGLVALSAITACVLYIAGVRNGQTVRP